MKGILCDGDLPSILVTLIDRLDGPHIRQLGVIGWGSPIAVFGDLSTSRVASVGLNPSNREFVDDSGQELRGPFRRFHTLNSLGLRRWSEVDFRHIQLILESFRDYFRRNPYRAWFRVLDCVISGTDTSYYDPWRGACHLDLIPYATSGKWTALSHKHQIALLEVTADSLGLLLRAAPVELLMLNGRSVVENFERLAGTTLQRTRMEKWSLPRRRRSDVTGYSFVGSVDSIGDIPLDRKVDVLGFNHNLQSSYGVSREIIHQIRDWVSSVAQEVLA
jgi:hypothetical protein